MGWPESVTYLLLVVLGYALTRIVDLVIDWQRNRLRLRAGDHAAPNPGSPPPPGSGSWNGARSTPASASA